MVSLLSFVAFIQEFSVFDGCAWLGHHGYPSSAKEKNVDGPGTDAGLHSVGQEILQGSICSRLVNTFCFGMSTVFLAVMSSS